MDNSTEWNFNQKSQIYNYIKLTLVQAQKIRLKKNDITYELVLDDYFGSDSDV